MSPSTRRAWIEISPGRRLAPGDQKVALHPEGVDRNQLLDIKLFSVVASPSTRRAWIEIGAPLPRYLRKPVALHPEGVDRNPRRFRVVGDLFNVALHPEGVDRNIALKDLISKLRKSPSTRRAWIEIWNWVKLSETMVVALHPEGVDRNFPPKERKR